MSQSHQLRRAWFAAGALVVAAAFTTGPAHPETMEQRYTKPVKAVAPTVIEVPVAGEAPALFPMYVSEDWSRPMPELRRAVLVFHGLTRNADAYFEGALAARTKAGSAGAGVLMISPQFLAVEDVEAHHLPARILAFNWNRWAGGEHALIPAPVSSFAAIDAVLA